MRVEVIRGSGDRTGPDISDALLCTEAAAIERGRIEIDRNSTPRELVSLTVPLTYIAPGSLVEVADSESAPWRGLVTGCRLTWRRDIDSLTAESELNIEREAL